MNYEAFIIIMIKTIIVVIHCNNNNNDIKIIIIIHPAIQIVEVWSRESVLSKGFWINVMALH